VSAKNESIGRVECPVKGCAEECPVYRYRERGESEKSVANRRFAGKLYGRCKDHGRFGGDAGDTAMQEYILCNATMNAPAGDRQAAPAPSQSQKVRPAAARSQTPIQTNKQTPSEVTSTARPAPTPAATPAESPRSSAWGFFQ
jgi:cell division septation protein DedD